MHSSSKDLQSVSHSRIIKVIVMNSSYFTLKKARDILAKRGKSYSLSYLRYLIKTKKLKAIKLANKWIISKKSLGDFLKSQNYISKPKPKKGIVRRKNAQIKTNTGWTGVDSIREKGVVLPLYFGYGLKISLIKLSVNTLNLTSRIFKKRWQEVVALILLICFVASGFFFRQLSLTRAATYNFTQTDWSGGTTTATATHPTNETGWNQFSTSTNTDISSVAGQLTLGVNPTPAGSVTQITDADFNSGTFASTTVSGTGTGASVVLSLDEEVSQVFAGNYHTLAIKTDGTLWAWGHNSYGELGLGATSTLVSSPTQVGTDTNWRAVAGGLYYTLAIKTDGTLWAWGYNGQGELGLGDTTDRYSPTQVGTDTNWQAVSTGNYHTLAIKTDGTLWAWGYNNDGQLGLGDTTNRSSPTQVGTDTNWRAVAGGAWHTLAIKTDGTLWAWGYNGYGQLGLGDTTDRSSPTQVGTDTNWQAIANGYWHASAIKTDGTLWAWGHNSYGELGLGDTDGRSSPTQVGTDTNWQAVAGGGCRALGYYTLAIKTDGTLWTWGYNNHGQLGLGDTTDRSSPTQVGTDTNWQAASGGSYHVLDIKTDGTLWAWGYNASGQLGLGDTDDRYSPTQVKEYYSSGAFTSSVLDIPNIGFGALSWAATTTASTTVKFQIASSPDGTTWSGFVGPDGTASTYYTTSGTQIWSGHNGNEYIKYKAYLSTVDTSQTPELGSVTIEYDGYYPSSDLTSSPYDTSDASNALAGIKWIESLPSASTTIKFQMRTAPDASGSPGTWTDWIGPDGTSTSYFADTSSVCSTSTVAEGTEVDCSVPNTIAIGDGSSDQWIQYKVFLATTDSSQTPTLKQVVMVYVVNAPPEFNPDYPTAGTGGVSASQNSDGSVLINYSIKDPDTDVGTVTPGYVTPSFEYSLDSGLTWNTATSSCFVTGDWNNKAVATSTFTEYSATWDPKCESGIGSTTYSTTAQVKVIIDDNEAANNTASSTTANFTLDTKSPTLGSPAISVDASQSPASVTFNVTDGSPLYMKVGLNSDLSDVASWSNYSSTTISLATDPDTVYAQFKDAYNNTSTIVSATTPETPNDMTIYDVSNASTSEWRLFVAWKVIQTPTPGFKQYNVYRSTDGSTYNLLSAITDQQINYLIDSGLSSSTTYYYKVTSQDSNDNISYFSTGVSDLPNGQGGTDITPPTISNVATTSLTTNSITITWATDELSNSYIGYSTTSGSFGTEIGVPSMVTSHSVTLSNLQPNTAYYFQVKSYDPSGNLATDNNGGQGYTFTTLAGPTISDVSVTEATNNTATIAWQTNIDSDSYVVYSTSSDLSSSQSYGSGSLTTDHQITLQNLTQGIKYYFYVKSTDGSGNIAYDKNVVNGAVQYYTLTTTQDTTPPVISSISSSVSTSTAIIAWKTDKLSDSSVSYGDTTSYGQTATSLTLTIDHSIKISNLTPNTTYHYQVASTDANGNSATSTDYTLTTLYLSVSTQNDTTPPTISNVATSTVSDTQATITWTTNELSTSQVVYGASTSYGSQTTKDTTPTYRHSVTISGLTKLTKYHYKVVSNDLSGNSASSTDYTFTTTDQPGIVKTISQGGGVVFIEKPTKPDDTPPIISSIEVKDITQTSVTIAWMTNEKADSFVKYGKTTDYGGTVGDPEESKTSHQIALTSLTPGSVYHFKIFGKDSYGNLGYSADKTFTTKEIIKAVSGVAVPEKEKGTVKKITEFLNKLTSPYSLSNISDALQETAQRVVGPPLIAGEYPLVETGSDWARITWVTDKKSNSLVAYAKGEEYQPQKEEPYTIVAGNPDEMVATHIVKLENLQPSTLYHFQVRSKAKIGDWAKSEDKTFITLSQKPEIKKLKFVSIGETEATLSWLTTLPTKTKIEVTNTKTGEKTTREDKSYLREHAYTLKDLEIATNYTLQIIAQDEKGNKSISSVLPFSTFISKNPPIISNVRIATTLIPGRIEKVQAIISWKTDKPSTSRVYFQQGVVLSRQLSLKTPLDKKLVLDHILITTLFKPGKVYQFKTESIDSFNNQSFSKLYTVLTPQPKQGVVDLIIKNFEDTFGFLKKLGT